MIPRLKAVITTCANTSRLCRSPHDILISSKPASSYLSFYITFLVLYFFFSKDITNKIRRLITACQQRQSDRRQTVLSSLFTAVLARETRDQLYRRRLGGFLAITCGNGLINVKVCIKSVKAVMMWVKQLTGWRVDNLSFSLNWHWTWHGFMILDIDWELMGPIK